MAEVGCTQQQPEGRDTQEQACEPPALRTGDPFDHPRARAGRDRRHEGTHQPGDACGQAHCEKQGVERRVDGGPTGFGHDSVLDQPCRCRLTGRERHAPASEQGRMEELRHFVHGRRGSPVRPMRDAPRPEKCKNPRRGCERSG